MTGVPPAPPLDLRGRVVIVTGAASGIGAATCRLLHQVGAEVVLADREWSGLSAVADELGDTATARPLAVSVDVTEPGQVDVLVSTAVQRHDRIDGLVNCAGIGAHTRVDEVDLAEFARALQVNVLGPATTMRAVVPVMRAAKFGRIVNVSSGTTRRVLPGLGAYAATKSALNMLSSVAREEFAGDGVVVSTVLPTYTDSEFHDALQAGAQNGWAGRPEADTAEHVAEEILRAVTTGVAEIDLPRVGSPGR